MTCLDCESRQRPSTLSSYNWPRTKGHLHPQMHRLGDLQSCTSASLRLHACSMAAGMVHPYSQRPYVICIGLQFDPEANDAVHGQGWLAGWQSPFFRG